MLALQRRGDGAGRRSSRRLLLAAAGLVLFLLAGAAVWYRLRYFDGDLWTREPIDAASRTAMWPWPSETREATHPGVTHWLDRSSPDGTVLDLLQSDFRENPHLEFSLFDQDQDDRRPFDNRAAFWTRGVAQVTKQLNEQDNGVVVAATNGLFFAFTKTGSDGMASHVGSASDGRGISRASTCSSSKSRIRKGPACSRRSTASASPAGGACRMSRDSSWHWAPGKRSTRTPVTRVSSSTGGRTIAMNSCPRSGLHPRCG